MDDNRPDHDTLWELIKDIKFGMFTHRGAHGMLHAHPLTTQNQSVDESATLYFFVQRGSEVATGLSTEQPVCVTYADPDSDSYVSVSGEARIDDDMAKKQTLFTPMSKAWYPEGPSDPNLVLVAVRLRHAAYWESGDSKVVQLFKITKAAITGDGPPDLGDHKEMRL